MNTMKSHSNLKEKILLIRFSSFGDVVQTLSVPTALHQGLSQTKGTLEIHWVTRSDFAPLIERHPYVTRVWSLDKKKGLRGLWDLAIQLSPLSITRIYDAHNNLRSNLLCFFLWLLSLRQLLSPPQVLRRSLRRWKRFLLFQLRYNTFEQPFSGQRDLLEPLVKWGISKTPPAAPQLFLNPLIVEKIRKELSLSIGESTFVALAPSAAFPLKRWPLEHWSTLIKLWQLQNPNQIFVLLGGPEDHFLNSLVPPQSSRIVNWAGRLSLEESAAVVKQSELLISNDTGLLHVGEQLGHPTVALMGPAPFGFPCRRPTTTILEMDLPCRPCSKHGQGPCSNPRFQWCLTGLRPEFVFSEAQKKLEGHT